MYIFLYRTVKFAFQGFFRNFWLSLVTVIILVLTIFTVSIAAGLNVVAQKALDSVQDKVDVSVYIAPDASDEKIQALRFRIEELSQVEKVTYVSPEEALEKFKEKNKDNPVILESIDLVGDNPLGATLIIKAKSIDDYPRIVTVLEDDEYAGIIEDNNEKDNEEVISRLSDISSQIQNIGIVVSAVFIIIAILIIFNTIRINIYTHREEISIMKLVGASNLFVRAPFLVESIMYALFAVIISLAILYPLLGVIAPQIDLFFEGYDFDLVNYFDNNFWQIIGLQVAFAVVLSFFSSAFAIGRYLRV